ncbi:hypothetical protein NEPAR06_0733 [Nematocida parisii]|uniref:Uncharacterized protein n=1 Tax=Nematocida parisii (strain ERTm3) TaxID=935791 RepID=I3EJ34_NEMP3|nr:uncharacterized protein NEPG_02469 [Nematocida parisii ERTm1]EIJ89231.1 hypothetical protein NEQG_00001 [Nematocida parisii ERTm3]KAI5143598.1 hypothetical protein NEPAR07_0698 [Nematocida parisii]EIJ92581.1 hypothetical protein NEPG_02469 [Nematocida parisii ERTm1]KAI5153945.1 hypothetical protein NEPAR06_0733 [Nematocida parisii]KAI5155948.1 hypothetical protein NEPAR05_0197 [Nematocida parisii]|eukprot:XP_013060296.1 hypothetical protein NEPG_02469 [Nematocida parisii ERTm1]
MFIHKIRVQKIIVLLCLEHLLVGLHMGVLCSSGLRGVVGDAIGSASIYLHNKKPPMFLNTLRIPSAYANVIEKHAPVPNTSSGIPQSTKITPSSSAQHMPNNSGILDRYLYKHVNRNNKLPIMLAAPLIKYRAYEEKKLPENLSSNGAYKHTPLPIQEIFKKIPPIESNHGSEFKELESSGEAAIQKKQNSHPSFSDLSDIAHNTKIMARMKALYKTLFLNMLAPSIRQPSDMEYWMYQTSNDNIKAYIVAHTENPSIPKKLTQNRQDNTFVIMNNQLGRVSLESYLPNSRSNSLSQAKLEKLNSIVPGIVSTVQKAQSSNGGVYININEDGVCVYMDPLLRSTLHDMGENNIDDYLLKKTKNYMDLKMPNSINQQASAFLSLIQQIFQSKQKETDSFVNVNIVDVSSLDNESMPSLSITEIVDEFEWPEIQESRLSIEEEELPSVSISASNIPLLPSVEESVHQATKPVNNAGSSLEDFKALPSYNPENFRNVSVATISEISEQLSDFVIPHTHINPETAHESIVSCTNQAEETYDSHTPASFQSTVYAPPVLEAPASVVRAVSSSSPDSSKISAPENSSPNDQKKEKSYKISHPESKEDNPLTNLNRSAQQEEANPSEEMYSAHSTLNSDEHNFNNAQPMSFNDFMTRDITYHIEDSINSYNSSMNPNIRKNISIQNPLVNLHKPDLSYNSAEDVSEYITAEDQLSNHDFNHDSEENSITQSREKEAAASYENNIKKATKESNSIPSVWVYVLWCSLTFSVFLLSVFVILAYNRYKAKKKERAIAKARANTDFCDQDKLICQGSNI